MNTERLEELKDVIANLPDDEFSMRNWQTCIAGYAYQQFVGGDIDNVHQFTIEREATRALELSELEAHRLFSPSIGILLGSDKKDAINAINRMILGADDPWIDYKQRIAA